MTMLKAFFKRQKGAMFGLDSRIALAIFGGLSVVMGASMVQVLGDRRVDNILLNHAKYSSAIDAMQEDLESNIHAAILSFSVLPDEDAFMALVDSSLLEAQFIPRWRGPYIAQRNNNLDEEYGTISIVHRPGLLSSTDCTATEITDRECVYFLVYERVPLSVIQNTNNQLDGEGEVLPAISGKVQWDGATATTARLGIQVATLLP